MAAVVAIIHIFYLCMFIFHSCDPFPKVDPDIEETEGDYNYDHIVLNHDQDVIQRPENDGNLPAFEEESGDGQALPVRRRGSEPR